MMETKRWGLIDVSEIVESMVRDIETELGEAVDWADFFHEHGSWFIQVEWTDQRKSATTWTVCECGDPELRSIWFELEEL